MASIAARRTARSHWLALFALLLVAACGDRSLQQGQDAFSKGAGIQNALYLPDAPRAGGAAMPTASAAILAYTDARKNLRAALDKHRGDLDADGLTGPALVLLAFTEVQLDALVGSPDGNSCTELDHRNCAKAAAAEADEKLKNQPTLFRDQFLLALIPGLLDHNQGLRLTALKPQEANRKFASAWNNVKQPTDEMAGRVRQMIVKDTSPQQLVIYGRMVQIQIIKAWVAALETASNPSFPDATQRLTGPQRDACLSKLLGPKFTEVVDALAPGKSDDVAVDGTTLSRWKNGPLYNFPAIPAGGPQCPWLP